MPKNDPELVPYYRPGTTEPEMVPKGSVPESEPVSQAPDVMTPGYVAPEPEEEAEEPAEAPKSAKKAATKARKK